MRVFLVLLAFSFTLVLCQTTVFVSPTIDSSGDGSMSSPYSSIRLALDNIGSHGTIVLLPGIYQSENDTQLQITDQQVTITSLNSYLENDENSTTSVFQCNITDFAPHDLISLYGSGSLTLIGLEFRLCDSIVSYSRNGASLANFPVIVSNCIFSQNSGDLIRLQHTNYLKLEDSVFELNNGHVVYFNGYSYESITEIINCSLSFSGGFYLNNVKLQTNQLTCETAIDRCIFFVPASQSGSYIQSSHFSNCNLQNDGAAVYIQGTALDNSAYTVTLERNHFSSNSAKNGGALWVGGLAIFVIDSVFSQNHADLGGGIYLSSASVNVQGCVFEENQAADAGGAIYIAQDSTFTVSSSDFTSNQAGEGTSLECQSQDDFIQTNMEMNTSEIGRCEIKPYDPEQSTNSTFLVLTLIVVGIMICLVVLVVFVILGRVKANRMSSVTYIGNDEEVEMDDLTEE